MRKLSPTFIHDLKDGFLNHLVAAVREDKDLNLEIRDSYLNIYYKGSSLLKLIERPGRVYCVEIHQKFRGDTSFSDITDEKGAKDFVGRIPELKKNIVQYGGALLELEYEQMIIRSNNREPRNTNEYFVVDRQYAIGSARFDLTGIYWPRENRRAGQVVKPCLMEVKFALNTDIREVHDQVRRYYVAIQAQAEKIAAEIEGIFHQKLDLGLYQQSQDRLAAMRTLTVANKIEDFQFVLILVDYNPSSTLFDIDRLKTLPFARQIRLFYTGFAMWDRNLTALTD